MAGRKVGEIFIDLVLNRTRFGRDLDDVKRKATDAGREIEGSATRGARAFAAVNTQVGALGQQLAGLSRLAGPLGGLAAAGGIAGGAIAAGGYAAYRGARFLESRAYRNDQLRFAQEEAALGIATNLQFQTAAANASALVPSERRAALANLERAQFGFQNNAELRRLQRESQTGRGRLGNIIGGVMRPFGAGLGLSGSGGAAFAGAVISESGNAISTTDDLIRENTYAERRQRIFDVNQRQFLQAEERALGITSNPAFQAASQLDDMRTMTSYMQEAVDMLRQITGQLAAPQPGGATP